MANGVDHSSTRGAVMVMHLGRRFALDTPDSSLASG
jgi:hypothetical protein